MSTIFATRRGFLYQDVYAVLEFLKLFQSKKLTEFYVDFSYDSSSQRSVDIKVVLTDGSTKVIEVKSGQSFKQDKRKKDSSEVRDAFLEFTEYRKLDNNALMVFALSPEFKGKPRIFEYWQNLINLHNIPTFSTEARRITNILHNKLRISDFSSLKELYLFVRNLEITPGDTDSHDNPDDPYSDIEDKAIQKVRDICSGTHFQAGATELELPCDILYYNLIYTCQKGAGSNTDIYSNLKNKILNFIARRNMLLKRSRDIDLYQSKVEDSFNAWISGTSIPSPLPTPMTTVSEGSIANE